MSLPIYNRTNRELETLIPQPPTLEKLMAAGVAVTKVIAADEFSLDAIVPFDEGLTLAYHMT